MEFGPGEGKYQIKEGRKVREERESRSHGDLTRHRRKGGEGDHQVPRREMEETGVAGRDYRDRGRYRDYRHVTSEEQEESKPRTHRP